MDGSTYSLRRPPRPKAGSVRVGSKPIFPVCAPRRHRQGQAAPRIDRISVAHRLSRTVELDRAQPAERPDPPRSLLCAFIVNAVTRPDQPRSSATRRQPQPPRRKIGRAYGAPWSIGRNRGKENSYGRHRRFRLLNSLASLPTKVGAATCSRGISSHTSRGWIAASQRSQAVGSWVEPTGQSQFLPRFICLAVDGRRRWPRGYMAQPGPMPGPRSPITSTAPGGAPASTGASRSACLRDSTGFGGSPSFVRRRCPRVHERHAGRAALNGVVAGSPTALPMRRARPVEPDGPGRTGYLLTTNTGTISDYTARTLRVTSPARRFGIQMNARGRTFNMKTQASVRSCLSGRPSLQSPARRRRSRPPRDPT